MLRTLVARDGPGNWDAKAREMSTVRLSAVSHLFELSLSKSCWLSQHRTGNSVEAQYYKCVVHKQPLRKGGRPAPPLKYEYELEVSRQHPAAVPAAACCVWTIGGLSCVQMVLTTEAGRPCWPFAVSRSTSLAVSVAV